MSMLSAQCDKLRERAKELRSLAPDPNVPYLVPSTKETMALAMRSAASEMEDAADTIWELRCKLSGMVDERERARVAEAENAKLRELVEAMPYCMEGKCLACPLCSHFEPALGNVPECEALPILHALGIYGDDEDKLGVTPF